MLNIVFISIKTLEKLLKLGFQDETQCIEGF